MDEVEDWEQYFVDGVFDEDAWNARKKRLEAQRDE